MRAFFASLYCVLCISGRVLLGVCWHSNILYYLIIGAQTFIYMKERPKWSPSFRRGSYCCCALASTILSCIFTSSRQRFLPCSTLHWLFGTQRTSNIAFLQYHITLACVFGVVEPILFFSARMKNRKSIPFQIFVCMNIWNICCTLTCWNWHDLKRLWIICEKNPPNMWYLGLLAFRRKLPSSKFWQEILHLIVTGHTHTKKCFVHLFDSHT